jgi:hypothetical protein
VTDKTKKLLERVINLGTRVSWLNGRCELGKEGYEELRGVVKEAMECLKPKEDVRAVLFHDGRGVVSSEEPKVTSYAPVVFRDERGLDMMALANKVNNLINQFRDAGVISDGDDMTGPVRGLTLFAPPPSEPDRKCTLCPAMRSEHKRGPDGYIDCPGVQRLTSDDLG